MYVSAKHRNVESLRFFMMQLCKKADLFLPRLNALGLSVRSAAVPEHRRLTSWERDSNIQTFQVSSG